MRTLDEVIKAMSICKNEDTDRTCEGCPMPDTEMCINELMTDALQYLKWYKELADDSETFAEWKENPPLTWDELKSMEGKPVWVEYKEYGFWHIVQAFVDDEIMMVLPLDEFPKKDIGKWRAYRKERT